MKRILIGVDAGGLANEALEQGLDLAKRLDAKIRVVHAVEVPPVLWPGIDKGELAAMHAAALASAREAVMINLEDACKKVHFDETAPEHLLTVTPGHSANVVLQNVEEENADIIVLGPHEKRSLLDFGNTTRAVLSQITIPVWVQNGPPKVIERIVVPIDFGDHSRHALDCACELASRLGASIEVLHVYSPPTFAYPHVPDESIVPTYVVEAERDAAKEQLERLIDEYDWKDVEATSTFIEGDVRSSILKNIESADLVVMGTHGRTGFSRFLLGSVAYGVLKGATTPVLLVPDPQRTWLLDRGKATRSALAATAAVL